MDILLDGTPWKYLSVDKSFEYAVLWLNEPKPLENLLFAHFWSKSYEVLHPAWYLCNHVYYHWNELSCTDHCVHFIWVSNASWCELLLHETINLLFVFILVFWMWLFNRVPQKLKCWISKTCVTRKYLMYPLTIIGN